MRAEGGRGSKKAKKLRAHYMDGPIVKRIVHVLNVYKISLDANGRRRNRPKKSKCLLFRGDDNNYVTVPRRKFVSGNILGACKASINFKNHLRGYSGRLIQPSVQGFPIWIRTNKVVKNTVCRLKVGKCPNFPSTYQPGFLDVGGIR